MELNTQALEATITKFDSVETEVKQLTVAQQAQIDAIEELKNEVANMATKSAQTFEPKTAKSVLANADFADLFKQYGKETSEVKQRGFEEFAAKALNLTNPADGKMAIAEVLDRDILKRARDQVGLIGQVGSRGMTRNTRRTVTTGFATVQDGFENVAGSSWPDSATPKLGEIKSHVAKRQGKYPITDEAMVGADINLWADLLSEVQIAENEYLERSILFGDGSDTSTKRSMRGILSSKRLDITNNSGQSWKPTYGTGARNLDFYPAFPTGVSTGMAVDDDDKINWLIDLMRKVKPVYRANSKFYMHDDTMQELKKIRDAYQRPIFTDYQDGSLRVFGKEIVTSDFMPVLDGSTPDISFIMFGQLDLAFNVTNGDVSKTILDEVTVDGQVILKKSQEYFEMAGANDAIVIGVATTNSGA